MPSYELDDAAVLPACPACGEPRVESDLVQRSGPVETYRCPSCGEEYALLVSYGHETESGRTPDNTEYAVDLSWAPDSSKARVVQALREVLPHYRDLPLSQVRARVILGPPVTHGGLVRPQADALRTAAEQHGLQAAVRIDNGEPSPHDRQEMQP